MIDTPGHLHPESHGLAKARTEGGEAEAIDPQEAAINAIREADRAVMAGRRGGA